MFSILLQTLLLASSGLFSVGSISIVLFFLITDIKPGKALAYSLGYFFSYIIIGFITVLIYSREQVEVSENVTIGRQVFLIILGILLISISRRKDSGKHRDFFERFTTFSALKVFLFGMFVTIINLKNLALYLSAISVVSTSLLLLPQKVLIMVLATLLFCLSLYIPILLVVIFPSRSGHILHRINLFIKESQSVIRKYIPLIFGTILIVKGVTGLL